MANNSHSAFSKFGPPAAIDHASIGLVKLTWPIFVENLLRICLYSVDVFMLSFYSEKAVAAMGLVGQLGFFIQLMYFMVATGASIHTWELIVVDNGSDDPALLEWLASETRSGNLRVVRDERPFNYSALNNRGVAAARGEVVALLNNDLEVITPGWLEEMVSHAVRPGIGAVGAMLYFPDDTVQHAGVVVGLGGVAGHPFKGLGRGAADEKNRVRLAQNFTAVTGACLVIRKSLFEEVGGLDAEALPVAFNDVDLCLKLHASGLRNLWTPFAEFHHHESASRGDEDTPEKRARFAAEVETMLNRWGLLLRNDPAFNPNLALHGEDLPLARPPRVRKPWLVPPA